MSKVHGFTAGLFFGLAVMALPAVARSKEPPVAPAVYNILTEEEEVALGRAAAAQVEQQMPMLDDLLLTAYVDSVGQQLAKQSRRPNLTYHFRIVDSPVVNARMLLLPPPPKQKDKRE